METLTMEKFGNIKDYLKIYGKTYAMITYIDGRQEKERLNISSSGGIMKYGKGKRRFGSLLNFNEIDEILLTPEVKRPPAERYADDLRRWARYILKNTHKNLWEELKLDALRITEEKLQKLMQDKSITSHFEAWKKSPDYDLPSIEGFKTITLTTCKYPYSIGIIKEHLDKKEPFRDSWRGNYDYHISGEIGKDGKYRAWLSAEFKGCGNGHYYLLLNENKAIFCEDD